jgi:hypothetical protein
MITSQAKEEVDRLKAQQRDEASRQRAATAVADAEARRKLEEATRAKRVSFKLKQA